MEFKQALRGSGVLCSGNGCSACAVPELAVSRLPSLVVGRLEIRRNLAEQAALPETDRNGRNEAASQRADRQAAAVTTGAKDWGSGVSLLKAEMR